MADFCKMGSAFSCGTGGNRCIAGEGGEGEQDNMWLKPLDFQLLPSFPRSPACPGPPGNYYSQRGICKRKIQPLQNKLEDDPSMKRLQILNKKESTEQGRKPAEFLSSKQMKHRTTICDKIILAVKGPQLMSHNFS